MNLRTSKLICSKLNGSYFFMLKIILVLFIFISLVLPAYASLYVSHVEGSNQVKNFRKITDTVSFNISSTSDIVSINGVNPTCQKESMKYYCAVSDTRNEAVVSYNIINQEGESVTASINVDNSIGEITYVLNNSNGNVTLNYDVADKGYNGNELCSGLSMLEVWWKGSNIDSITFNDSECSKKGVKTLSVIESGEGEFYIEVTDKLENKKRVSKNITLDVDAPEIISIEIYNNGLPLNIIAPNTDFDVIVEFKIKERNLTSLVADLSQLTNNPVLKQVYKNTIIPLSSCGINISENINFYDCKVRGISLNVNKNSILINVTALDSSGNKVTEQLEKSFTIDNIIPNVKIFTDYCNNDICYVKNGINKLIFELSKDNFEKKQIFFSIAETSGRVVNCTGNQCIGFANINCNGPLEIRILTSNPTSQDDSGNRLPSYSRKLLCDNSIPQITGVNWSSNNQLGENLLITGATINLEVDVNELDSGVIANAYFDLIKNETINAVCTNSTGNLFMCKWVVSPIREGYYDANVIINVSDLVNNTITRTEKVRILGFKSDNLTPSNLMASLTKTVPSRLNRAVLKLAEFNKIPVYAHAYYSVSVKQGVDVQLLSQDLSVDDCVIKLKNQDIVAASLLFSEIKIVDKYKGIGNDHRIDFTFATSSGNYNIFEDDTRVLCNISAYVREGKYVYKKPQILIIEIPFQLRNSQLDAPGEEYVKKIKDIEKSTTSDYSMLIANLDSFMTKAQSICNIKNTLDYAGLSGVTIQLIGFSLGPVLGSPLKESGGSIFQMSKELQELFYNPDEEDDLGFNNKKSKELPFMGIIGQACTFMSCELEWNKPLQPDESLADSITEIGKKLPLGLGEELTDGLTNSDLKNSMVMSALKLCIPGVVYNLNKYRQVDCEYLECLKVYSASGLDVSQCDVMKASKTCSIIVGEVFEIPYVRIGKNLFSNMADVVRMSFGTGLVEVLKLFSDSDVCKSSESDTAIILCNVPYALNQYISGQKKTSMSKEFTYDSSRDFCQTAGCVGPDCYPSNSLFGIPVPQYVPTKEQKLQMDVYRRFGGLSEYTYLIVNAHGSQNPEIRKRNIEEWNIKVQDYNKKYSKNYPQIPLEAAQFNDNSQLIISSYFNNFNEKDGVNNDDKKEKDKFYKINQVDPRTKYDSAKQEARAMFLKIQSNPLYIGQKIRWGYEDVENNRKPSSNKQYESLLKVLPYGSDNIKIVDDPSLTSDNKFYYFKDNVLYYHEKENDKKSFDIKILTFDNDGYPVEHHLDVDDTKLSDRQRAFIKLAKNGNLLKRFEDYKKDSEELKQKIEQYSEAKKEYRIYMLKQKAMVFVNIFMNQLGLRKFLTADYWVDKFGPAEYITKVANAVDPEIWKNNLCNPDNGPLLIGSEQPEGTVYSCYNSPGKGCKLVLSYGAEYLDYENNTYLYTITYLVGPVVSDVSFNIVLKGPSGSSKWYERDRILPAHNYDSNAVAILSKKKYTQICVSFKGNFPDRGDSAKDFCRPIRQNVFNTGRPIIDNNVPGYPSGNIGSGKPFNGG